MLTEAIPTGILCLPSGRQEPARFSNAEQTPLVSCVMVSRGNEKILRHSINCFLRQNYANRELIVVLHGAPDGLQAYFDLARRRSPAPIEVYRAPSSLSLGDVRNMSIARARGALVCQWDDDDLHHPMYLEYMVRFIVTNNAGAAFLRRCTIWWPKRKLISLSIPWIWENSMVARRDLVPIYPNLSKREDTTVMKRLTRNYPHVLVSAPNLYVYAVTGRNTWDAAHMEMLLANDSQCSSASYEVMFEALNSLYQLDDYQDYCLQITETP